MTKPDDRATSTFDIPQLLTSVHDMSHNEIGDFGGCPKCGKCNEYLNYRRSHWFICLEHRLCWQAGENLFSTWRHESPEDWERNAVILRTCQVVEPAYEPISNVVTSSVE